MRVTIVTQYFPPETGGPQNRMASLAKGLRRAGHVVSVITAKPNYPGGEVYEGYREGFFLEREYEDIPVIHASILADREKSLLRRLLQYLSFGVSSVLASLRRGTASDVVLASSPPLSVGLAGWLVARLEGARFVFDVRDLWPDVAVAMGQLPDGAPTALARSLERFVYRRADGISTATDGFCEVVTARCGPETPVVRISNGTVPETFDVRADRRELRAELGLPGGFIVTYAGNVGLAQRLDYVLDAAAVLERETSADPVTFLFLGEGADRDRLARRVEDEGIDSVIFRDRVPLETASRFMAASDALMVCLGRLAIYRKFVPSKLYDCMAAARPILSTVEGEARDILEETGAGIFCSPRDPAEFAEAVRWLRDHPDRAATMGDRGRKAARARFSRKRQAARMADFLEDLIGDRPVPSRPGSDRAGDPGSLIRESHD